MTGKSKGGGESSERGGVGGKQEGRSVDGKDEVK